MKKGLLALLILAFAVTFAVAEVNKGAEKINMHDAWKVQNGKQPHVTFDHAFHQSNNECVECHDTAEGGNFIPEAAITGANIRNGAHAICWTCHTEKKVSIGRTCVKCHVRS